MQAAPKTNAIYYYEVSEDTPNDTEVTVAQLRSLMESEKVSCDTRLWCEGMDDWTKLQEVPDVWRAVCDLAEAKQQESASKSPMAAMLEAKRKAAVSEAGVPALSTQRTAQAAPKTNATYYYEVSKHTPSGTAVTVADISSLLERGKVSSDTHVWCEGMDGWMELRDVPDVWSAVSAMGKVCIWAMVSEVHNFADAPTRSKITTSSVALQCPRCRDVLQAHRDLRCTTQLEFT